MSNTQTYKKCALIVNCDEEVQGWSTAL